MGIRFTAASLDALTHEATAPVPTLGAALSFGMWFKPASAPATATLFSLWSTVTAGHKLELSVLSGTDLRLSAAAGGTAANFSSAGACVVGEWNYVLVRIVSGSARYVASIQPTGGFLNPSASTTARAVEVNSATLGALGTAAGTYSQYFDGTIAEFFLADRDIGNNSAAVIDPNLMREFAFRGPISFPELRSNIIVYHSGIGGLLGKPEGFFSGTRAGIEWAVRGSPYISDRPPLSGSYDKLNNTIRPLLV